MTKLGREPINNLVHCECSVIQPPGTPPNVKAGIYKGHYCTVLDYNPYTAIATVVMQQNNHHVQLPACYLAPRYLQNNNIY
jgi:hypothetical protein